MFIEWLMELKDQIDRHGIRVGLILTLFVMYRKELRNLRLDKRDEAMFLNQRIMMDHLGIGSQYNGQPTVSHRDLMNYEQLQQYYSAAISRVGYQSRRGNRMIQALTSSISKKLAAFIIAAAVTVCNNKFGLELNSDTIYGLYVIAIAYIIGQSHVDAKKAISSAVNAVATSVIESASTTDGTPITTITAPPLSYQETVPYLKAISGDLQQIYDQLKSGKHTDETQRALNIALTVHDYLQKSKGA